MGQSCHGPKCPVTIPYTQKLKKHLVLWFKLSSSTPVELNEGKAAGPDRLKPLLLRGLWEEIAPISKIIFDRSAPSRLGEGQCHARF